MKDHYKKYFLVGPYFEDKAKTDFEKIEIPKNFKKIFNDLETEGIKCHYGKWLIPSEPLTILIDFSNFSHNKDWLKKFYWEKFQIDSLFSSWDFEEPMLFSTAVGKLLEKFMNELNNNSKNHSSEIKVSAQFHEWMTGFAGLYLKDKNIKIGTVFTTHATMLGRTLCAHNWNLYESLDNFNPEIEARRYQVVDKFSTEKACAHNCDVFTTVSEITGIEAEKILGKKPDILVLNGLDLQKFPTIEETSIKHNDNRELIREFLSYFFYPYYTFDMEENLIFFVVGRYEYKNKGLDILTKALAKLNQQLKSENSNKTITVFYWIPGDAKGIRNDVLENKTFFRHLRNYILRHSEEIQKNVIKNVLSQKENYSEEDIFSKEFMQNNKKHIMRFKRTGLPPLSTHYIGDEFNDAIIKGFKENGLLNREDDKVKVILYPVYLNGVDGLIDLTYYEALVGCHLGIFASYYEPWGYTPLESAALGVPAITTDLAGFGRFIKEKDERVNKTGIFVLDRFGKNEEEVVNNFTKVLYNYSILSRHKRVENKVDAKELADYADWNELVLNYFKAHDLAVKKVWQN